jgi:hypothetical protein
LGNFSRRFRFQSIALPPTLYLYYTFFPSTPTDPFPSAWDYQFSRINEPLWILVTLKDGSQVAGRFGRNSLASLEPSERDLYIDSVYQVLEDNPWQPVTETFGILIKAEEIRYIEFLNDPTEDL